MADVVATLVRIFAPWQSLYSDSKFLETAVTGVHLLAMLIGGGLAIAADRTTLRLPALGSTPSPTSLAELHAIHRPVLVALGVSLISGLALATADVKTFATSPFFLVKILLVTGLCINGSILYRAERRLQATAAPHDWARLRAACRRSIALWILTLFAGAALVNAG